MENLNQMYFLAVCRTKGCVSFAALIDLQAHMSTNRKDRDVVFVAENLNKYCFDIVLDTFRGS